MWRDQQVAYLVAALFVSYSQSALAATTVTETTTTGVPVTSNLTTTFSFGDVANADELVSISGGSVNFAEGGTFSINVDYANGTSAQIYSDTGPRNSILELSSIGNLTFAPGTIDGFSFMLDLPGWPQVQFGNIPAQTSFVIGTDVPAVPEPSTWAMMLMGTALVGWSLRRRRLGKDVLKLT